MKFESIALSVQEKKFKTDFQVSRNLGFPIAMIWAIFDLQVTPMHPTKFRVKWPFSSEEEGKNRFSRFPVGTILAIFISTSHPEASYQFSIQIALRFRIISEIRSFKMAAMTAILNFPIQTIKAILDLQITRMLPTKFRVKWLFNSGEEAKNRFSRWLSWRPSWISDRDDFSYFWSTGHPDASNLVWSQ